LIHFVAIKAASALDVPQPLHVSVEILQVAGLTSEELQPFTKCSVESRVLRFGNKPRLLNEASSARRVILFIKAPFPDNSFA
jgi:hypothetical protein